MTSIKTIPKFGPCSKAGQRLRGKAGAGVERFGTWCARRYACEGSMTPGWWSTSTCSSPTYIREQGVASPGDQRGDI